MRRLDKVLLAVLVVSLLALGSQIIVNARTVSRTCSAENRTRANQALVLADLIGRIPDAGSRAGFMDQLEADQQPGGPLAPIDC